jgi:hypothetical protein
MRMSCGAQKSTSASWRIQAEVEAARSRCRFRTPKHRRTLFNYGIHRSTLLIVSFERRRLCQQNQKRQGVACKEFSALEVIALMEN